MKKRKIESSSDEEEELFDFPELQSCDKKTKNEYEFIRKEIANTEPNLVSILNTPLLLADKISLFQLYEVYVNIPDFVSAEKLETRKQLQTLLSQAENRYKQHHKYTSEEHKVFETQLAKLEQQDEYNDLKYQILRLNTTEHNKQLIYREYKRYIDMAVFDDEKTKLYTWLRWAVSLPYDNMQQRKEEQVTNVLQRVRQRLDDELYGMNKVKEQILVFLNARLTNPQMKNLSLGLLGPAGCGKTTIVRILADILHYPLEQISMGGVFSPDFLKGHSYTYIGAQPGEIVKRMCKMGVKDGILFFDEYDKVENKEVNSTLLHITDRSQNSKFEDNYLNGIDIDLSYLWMIFSMNKRNTYSPKDDRIFYIELDSYTQGDKFFIVRDYLIKKAHCAMNWNDGNLSFSDDAINYLVETMAPQSTTSIRPLEDCVFSIFRKVNFLIHQQDKKGVLKRFKCSFDIGQKVNFPFQLDINTIVKFMD